MRKILTVLSIVLLLGALIFFFVDQVDANTDLTRIRVKLSIGDPVQYSFTAVGDYTLEEVNGVSYTGTNYFKVELVGNDVKLYHKNSSGTYEAVTTKRTISFKEANEDKINLMYLNNSRYYDKLAYRGDMMFYKDTEATHLHAINDIDIELYLMGVVGYEMSNGWPLEALKTQAVCARSYAIKHIGASTYYDVVDTTGSQVYKGWNDSLDNVLSAVWDTRGLVVTYVQNENDRNDPDYNIQKTDIVNTFFSASNGGQMDIPQHVWNTSGSPNPWERIKSDPYDIANPSSLEERVFYPYETSNESDFHSNALKQIKDAALPILQTMGYEVDSRDSFNVTGIKDIRISQGQIVRNSSGGIKEDHTKDFGSEHEQCIDMIWADMDVSVFAPKGGGYQEETITIGYDLEECDKSGGQYQIFDMTQLRVTTSEKKMSGDTVLGFDMIQRRYGHGLGMSQRGAQTMAKQDMTYDQIVLFYFPNTQLRSIYGSGVEAESTPTPVPSGEYNGTVKCNTWLNVRTGPSSSYEKIGKLYPETRIKVITPFASGAWHLIEFNGNQAYIHKDYVLLDEDDPSATPTPTPTTTPTDEPTATPTATPTTVPTQPVSGDSVAYEAKGIVSCSVLNVRQDPSSRKARLSTVSRNQTVYITDEQVVDKWHEIYYNGQIAYVYAAYIKTVDDEDGYVTYSSGQYIETDGSSQSSDPTPTPTPTSTPTSAPTSTPTPTTDSDGDQYGTVTASALNIRSGPSERYSKIGKIPLGGVIEILELGDSWSKVNYGGITGYVSSKYFVINKEGQGTTSGEYYAIVLGQSLRVRSGPGTSYSVLEYMPKGTEVEVYSYDNSWAKIKYNGIPGYTSVSYLDIREME